MSGMISSTKKSMQNMSIGNYLFRDEELYGHTEENEDNSFTSLWYVSKYYEIISIHNDEEGTGTIKVIPYTIGYDLQ